MKLGAVVLAGCRQPQPVCGEPRQCLRGHYCLCRVYADAERICIGRGEGWRWRAANQACTA